MLRPRTWLLTSLAQRFTTSPLSFMRKIPETSPAEATEGLLSVMVCLMRRSGVSKRA